MTQALVRAARAVGRWIGGFAPGNGVSPVLFLAEYRATIDGFNAGQPNTALLEAIRAHNHGIVDQLDTIRPLRGTLVLDVGASPHGYALERALERGAALYVGVGLDIRRAPPIVGEREGIGFLLTMDATSLRFLDGMFDWVVSVNALEHVGDVEGVLSEIARVLRPDGLALLTFEPVWSCSYGHHLHHFGDCARLVPPWAHLTWSPRRMRRALAGKWPADAPLSLDDAIRWVYHAPGVNRLTVRDFRERLGRCPLRAEWTVDLKEAEVDREVVAGIASTTGLTPDELTTKGLSVLLRKEA
jgi:SAM-dependent methyltransferase